MADSDANGDNNWPIIDFRVDNTSGNPEARIYYKQDATSLILATSNTNALTLDSSQNATFAGDIGIGMTPTHNLNVYNDGGATSMTVGKYASGKTVGFIGTSADTNGYFLIQSYKSQGTTLGNIVLNGAGGNVGIGTNAPAHKFHVNGISTTDNEPVVWLHNSHNASNKDGTVISTTNDGDDAEVLHVRTNNTTYNNGTSLMLVRGDGNVGIGTDSPTSLMHIQSNDSTTNAEVDMLTLQALSTGTTTTGFGGAIKFQAERNNGVSQNVGKIRSIAEVNSGSNISSGLSFETGTFGTLNESMRITYDGKVGIGISSINGVFTAYGTPMTAISAQTVADIFGDVQQDADKGGGIGLGGRYITDSSSVTAFAEISGVKANNTSSNYEGEMVFKTRVNGGNLIERMRLDINSRISLSNNDSGTSNTVFGKLAGASIDAGSNYNTFIGENVADASLDDAIYNSAIGYSTLSALTSGDYNTAIGSRSLLQVNSGSQNTALGYYSGYGITTGANNVHIGALAGEGNTGASYLVGIGDDTFRVGGVTSDANGAVAVGYQSLKALTSGARNTAVGYQSLMTENTGSYHTALGYEALKVVDAPNGHNTGLGHKAGVAISSGSSNTVVGSSVAEALTTGTNNTIVGASADVSSSGASNETVIGQGATGAGDNSVVLGNSDVTAVLCASDGEAQVYASAIRFPATQVANSNANALDDYEEGLHTPTIVGSSSGNYVLNTSFDNLSYTKIGRQVTLTGEIRIASDNSTSGELRFSLPFATADLTETANVAVSTNVHLSAHGNADIDDNKLLIYITEGSSFFRIAHIADDDTFTWITHTSVDGAWNVTLTLTYFTS